MLFTAISLSSRQKAKQIEQPNRSCCFSYFRWHVSYLLNTAACYLLYSSWTFLSWSYLQQVTCGLPSWPRVVACSADDDAQGFLRPVAKSMKLSGGQYICQACLSGSSVLRHWLLALFSTATDGSKWVLLVLCALIQRFPLHRSGVPNPRTPVQSRKLFSLSLCSLIFYSFQPPWLTFEQARGGVMWVSNFLVHTPSQLVAVLHHQPP